MPLPASLETILVVEDTPVVLATVASILQRAGFEVLSASTPAGAIQIEEEFHGTIHLLLSDVMMPDMAGPDLAKLLKQSRPEMRVMLMSGYPDGGMLVLNYGWYFIQKPFVPAQLVMRINEVLHAADRSQGADHFETRQ